MSILITITQRFPNLPGRLAIPLANIGWFTPADVLLFLRTKYPHVRMREDAENAIRNKILREPSWGPRTSDAFLVYLKAHDVI